MFVVNWTWYRDFAKLIGEVLARSPIHTGEWQAMDTRKSRAHATHEMEDITIVIPLVPDGSSELGIITDADLTWAEQHFQERVSGTPLNPAPSHLSWPYAVRGNTDHTSDDGVFDHTYPERFWPKYAGCECAIADECTHPMQGIRFAYGDLSDVVSLLVRSPLTRQAFLPVWFPEDTGATEKQRVPCTLGYHFMIRDGSLSCRYYIRSCDVYRHLRNDLYLAGRLMQWVCKQINNRSDQLIRPGRLVMHIASLHAFVGDRQKLEGLL